MRKLEDRRNMGMQVCCICVLAAFVFTANIVSQSYIDEIDQLIEKYDDPKGNHHPINGEYQLYYKTHLIEKGHYKDGEKVGVWTYYNLGDAFEFQYNYDLDSLVRISGVEQQKNLRYESPVLFLGSPLVPYAFLTSKVGYPLDAYEAKVEGKVDLFLVISPQGRIIRRYVADSDHSYLTSAILKASRDFPKEWQWIPERRNNQKIQSVYKITIYFELL